MSDNVFGLRFFFVLKILILAFKNIILLVEGEKNGKGV